MSAGTDRFLEQVSQLTELSSCSADDKQKLMLADSFFTKAYSKGDTVIRQVSCAQSGCTYMPAMNKIHIQ
jgi:hypothetical protein